MELVEVQKSYPSSERVRITALARYDSSEIGTLEDSFYFEFPIEVERDLVETGDPWLVMFLPISVVQGETLRINLPVESDLLDGCLEVLEIWNCWMPWLPVIEVQANTYSEKELRGKKTASFFSGGVDSLHTLHRHHDNPDAPRAEKIDELLTIFGILGFERELIDQNRAASMRTRMESTARKYNKKLIEVHTNIWQTKFSTTNSLEHSHSCILATVALLLGRRYSKVLIPSTISYRENSPGGSHPLTDRLFSTNYTRIVPDASDSTRYEKIAYLARNNHDLSSLQVCSRDAELKNCSVCYKCIRAMLMLEVLGKLGECELFRKPELDLNAVTRIYCSTSHLLGDLNCVIEEAKARNRNDIVEAIDLLFQRSSWIDAVRGLIGRLQERQVIGEQGRMLVEELTGKRECSACSEETRVSIKALLAGRHLLKMYLESIALESGMDALNQPQPSGDDFRALEQALLAHSICESTLDRQLRKGQKLRKPEIIYISKSPFPANRVGAARTSDKYDGDTDGIEPLEHVGSGNVRIVNADIRRDGHHIDSGASAGKVSTSRSVTHLDKTETPGYSQVHQTVLEQVLKNIPDRPIRLVDIHCGSGALAQYIATDFLYLGIDFDKESIDYAKSRSLSAIRSPRFEVRDFVRWANNISHAEEPRADVLIFNGFLGGLVSHLADTGQMQSANDERQFVENCLKHRLKKSGLVSVITPYHHNGREPGSASAAALQRRYQIEKSLPLQIIEPIVETFVLGSKKVQIEVGRTAENNKGRSSTESKCASNDTGAWCSLFKSL